MKDTFDKVVMDEEKQEEIRAALMGKKRAKKTWLAPLVAVAAAIAVIMIVPYTRAVVVRAAGEILRNITVIHNGTPKRVRSLSTEKRCVISLWITTSNPVTVMHRLRITAFTLSSMTNGLILQTFAVRTSISAMRRKAMTDLSSSFISEARFLITVLCRSCSMLMAIAFPS